MLISMGDTALPAVDIFRPDAPVLFIVFFEDTQPVLVNPRGAEVSFTEKEISLIDIKRNDAYWKDSKFLFDKFVDLRTAGDCSFHEGNREIDNFFQFYHQFIVLNHLLIQQLEFFHLKVRQ